MRIGIAGTGRMGTEIALRLVASGHEVRVWNRTADKALAAQATGATWTSTPAALVAGSEVVISSLLDDAALERVYLGADGLLAAGAQGRLLIDMSTVTPAAQGPIAAAAVSAGAAYVECPVSGSTAAVRAGALVGFAGGEAPAVARARPVLGQLCRRVEHVGALGAGARMKLSANLLLAVFWQALGESLLLVQPSALDPARAIELLADSNIGATILRTRSAQIVAAMNGVASRPAAFDVDTMRKDLRYMAGEAAVHGRSLPLAARTLECFDGASLEGQGGVDGVAYPAYWLARQRG